jgi:hypothetical protein
MKPRTRILLTLAAVLLLFSCAWLPNSGQGGLRLDLAPVASRGIGDYYARVWLVADGELLPLDAGRAYVAAQLSYDKSTTIVIEGIPVGPSYQVLLSMGRQEDGYFGTQQWGESADFELEQGQNTEVSITWASLPFFPPLYPVTDMMGKDLKGLLYDDEYSNIYTAESRVAHRLSWPDLTLYDSYDLAQDLYEFGVQDVIINSLSRGNNLYYNYPGSWINSNRGIIPFENVEGWVFTPNFSQNLGSLAVAESGVVPDDPDFKVFYRQASSIGGTTVLEAMTYSPESWTWVSKDLERVSDFLATTQHAYYATAGKGVRVGVDFLSPPYSLSANRVDFSVPADILSFFFLDTQGVADELFMGTSDGVWRAPLDEFNENAAIKAPSRISGTEGYRFHMMATSDTNQYAAFLAGHDLFAYEVGSQQLRRFPIAAGFPGQIRAMTIVNLGMAAPDWTLLIAGEEGLVRLSLTDIFPS